MKSDKIIGFILIDDIFKISLVKTNEQQKTQLNPIEKTSQSFIKMIDDDLLLPMWCYFFGIKFALL